MGGRSENTLKLALLAVAIAVGAYLRFDGLGEPSYWLDEILHQEMTTKFAAQPWWHWLGRMHEEHAGLYYLTQLATRLFGTTEFAGRLAAALLGLATIPILFGVRPPQLPLSLSLSNILAAILLATSPLHVYYSREARGYALLMFLTAALLVVLVRARSLLAVCLVLVAMLYSSAVASTVVAAAAAVAFLVAFVDREHRRWYATAGACASVTLALFRVIYASRPVVDPSWPGLPPLDWQFATVVARMFSVSALGEAIAGRAAAATFLLAVIGAVAIARRDRRTAIVLIGMTVLPFAVSIAALQVFHHFFAVRYVIASLIGYVLLAGIGIASLAGLARKAAPAVAMAIVCILAAQGWSAARTEPFRKLDWRGIAGSLRRHVRPGDVILAAEPWSEVSLRYYLGEIPNVQLVHMAGVGIAEIMLHENRAAWLVTAGSSVDTSVRSWMCRYPLVMSSALEDFRLHYAPSRRDFFEHRTGAAEQRAVSAALGDGGFTIRMEDDLLLDSGWENVEGSGQDTFRWVAGHRATVLFPRRERRDRVIRFSALPHLPQTMRVSLNGHAIDSIPLAPAWVDYTVAAKAPFWNEGLNTLTFDLEKAAAPSLRDHRPLAAAFQWIAIDDPKPSGIPSMRIAADTFIDEKTAWRNTTTRFPPDGLQREPIEALLGRLGYDPVAGWRKLTSGEIRLEDAAETVAYGDCEDDTTFLDRAFAVLLEHPPDEIAERDLLRRLHEGASRQQVIRRILRSDEFTKEHSRGVAR